MRKGRSGEMEKWLISRSVPQFLLRSTCRIRLSTNVFQNGYLLGILDFRLGFFKGSHTIVGKQLARFEKNSVAKSTLSSTRRTFSCKY